MTINDSDRVSQFLNNELAGDNNKLRKENESLRKDVKFFRDNIYNKVSDMENRLEALEAHVRPHVHTWGPVMSDSSGSYYKCTTSTCPALRY